MKIRVIASHPTNDQDGIEDLIGEVFEVKFIHKHGEISIDANDYDLYAGLIILNEREYEVIEA
jgi:hypothetical protein